jgi:hypothetical protein
MNREPAMVDGKKTIVVSLAIAALGALFVLVGGIVDLRRLCFSYLAAWGFATYLAVGALLFLLTCHAMQTGWPTAVRRLLEGMVGVFPVLLVLFLPVLAMLPVLYPWVHPERIADEHARHVIEHKAAYLNPAFFVVRALIYFAIWIGLSSWLRKDSFEQARGAPRRHRMYVISGAALPVVALTLVFSSFDWLMSIEQTWYSTMFPVYVFGGGFVGAIAALTVIVHLADRRGDLPGLDVSHYYALGRLLLAFTIFWAYAAFFQFMLIWIGNKPDEVTYYLDRWLWPWAPTSLVLVLTRFVVPFTILMTYRIKRRPPQLAWMAGFIVASAYVDAHWMVVPKVGPVAAPYHWIDLAALAFVGGLSVAFATWRLRGRPVVPVGDPRLEEAFAYRSV